MSTAGAAPTEDVILNDTEFLSAHWLAEGFPARLASLAKDWRERSKGAPGSDPLHALAGVSGNYLAALRAADDDAESSGGAALVLTEAHRLLAGALGLRAEGDPKDSANPVLETLQGDRVLRCPVLVIGGRPERPDLLVLDAVGVDGPGSLLSSEVAEGEPGALATPLVLAETATRETAVPAVARALSELFASDASPRYALVLAGRWALLTDAPRWSEGRYLALDLVTAMERREATSSGGLARIAGLVSGEVLLPSDTGVTLMDELTKESTTHAVGVSEDLRIGLRRSIEIIANDVVSHLDAESLAQVELPDQLARQSLRFLYRILFLLYAEAHPELGVVPTASAEYQAGYGLDRLRDIVFADLPDSARRTHHLHASLDVLFRLVAGDTAKVDELPAEDLRADLFDRGRTPLIDGEPGAVDRPWLSDEALHEVLRLLLLSSPRAKGGRRSSRGWISYANLGINQLGAVYEGLMSYTGVLTREPMVEVARGGDASKGSWLVPQSEESRYAASDIVRFSDPATGEERFRRYGAGEFAFRLSGRDRERSASYYTPEVLTQLVVRHSLAELITEDTTAEEILSYRVCEPALGSGAFANEAVNQLADAYLERRQRELGERIEPDALPLERRRVKAWIALHRVHGVDLNATAVELAEVSMWLNVMQPDMTAPWFGLHLRRGNSLIGARRAVYDLPAAGRAKTKPWTESPQERRLAEVPLGDLTPGEVHHFLLPTATWGAVADAKQAKELAPEEVAGMRAWRKAMLRRPSTSRPDPSDAEIAAGRKRGRSEAERVEALAARVERAWSIAARRLEVCEAEASRDLPVWGMPGALRPRPSTVTRARIEESLRDPDSMYQRLRLVMDVWCALSFWPLDRVAMLPDWGKWLSFLEDTLGVASLAKAKAKSPAATDVRLDADASFDDLDVLEGLERAEFRMRPAFEVTTAHPWVAEAAAIADREGFFHWELDFAQVFTRGGFDLQVGNPPWVRLDWKDDATLAEADPWFLLQEKIPDEAFKVRRTELLESQATRSYYLTSLASGAGATAVLGSAIEHPVLSGIRTNLYMNFMERTWRSQASEGVIGLIHPSGHFRDPHGGVLRGAAYRRLRRHWMMINGRNLFEDVNSTEEFSISIYGCERDVDFLQMSGLSSVEVLENSFEEYVRGRARCIEYGDPDWRDRPSGARVARIGALELKSWAALLDEAGTPAYEARLVRSASEELQGVLDVLGAGGVRLGELGVFVSQGWNEKTAAKKGVIRREKCDPNSWSEVILQGPHFEVGTPFFKNPNIVGFGKGDYSPWELLSLGPSDLPRVNFVRAVSRAKYEGSADHRYGRAFWEYWRVGVRSMVREFHVRTLKAALLPPGAAHVHAVHSCTASTCAAPVHACRPAGGGRREAPTTREGSRPGRKTPSRPYSRAGCGPDCRSTIWSRCRASPTSTRSSSRSSPRRPPIRPGVTSSCAPSGSTASPAPTSPCGGHSHHSRTPRTGGPPPSRNGPPSPSDTVTRPRRPRTRPTPPSASSGRSSATSASPHGPGRPRCAATSSGGPPSSRPTPSARSCSGSPPSSSASSTAPSSPSCASTSTPCGSTPRATRSPSTTRPTVSTRRRPTTRCSSTTPPPWRRPGSTPRATSPPRRSRRTRVWPTSLPATRPPSTRRIASAR